MFSFTEIVLSALCASSVVHAAGVRIPLIKRGNGHPTALKAVDLPRMDREQQMLLQYVLLAHSLVKAAQADQTATTAR